MIAESLTWRRRLASGLVAAVALGLVLGLLGGQPQRVSVEIWLAVATGWFAWLLLGELRAVAPLRPDRTEALFGRRRSATRTDRRARRLANLEGLIANAAHSQRAASVRLRPRLVSLCDELLRTRHGIDRIHEPDAVAELLGDVAWIVDEEHELPRSPTPAEVELLVVRAGGGRPDPDADRLLEPRREPEPGSRRSPLPDSDSDSELGLASLGANEPVVPRPPSPPVPEVQR